MASIERANEIGFQNLFTEFPYIPLYKPNKTYFKDDIVYFNQNFYKLECESTTKSPRDCQCWVLTNDSTDNYITSNLISRAMLEARINFNPSLFENDDIAIMLYYYLTAHYLVVDLNNMGNPLAMGYNGFTQSKSVGSVSESFAVPQWAMNNKSLVGYTTTGYGRKYLSLIGPYLVGQVMLIKGCTTIG